MTIPGHVEIDYSEYGQNLYQLAMSQRIPISGGMEITHRCNLRCVHCYVASDHYPKEVDTAGWIKIIDQIADAGCFWFYITGGEAMIRPDFLDIYLHAKKKGMRVVVLSNATCVTDKIADTFAEYPPQCVEISMYGATEETFDQVGKVKFGYRRFIQGMEKLLVRHIPIKLKTMALKENMHEVMRIKAFAQSLGLSFRYDAIINGRLDHKLSPYGHGLTPDETIALEIQDEDKAKLWKHFCTNHMGTVESDNVYRCGAGRSTFNVDPYGRLSVCLLSRRPNYDVLAGSFLEGWKVAVGEEINRKKPVKTKCDGCDVGQLCGNCTGYTDLHGGLYQAPIDHLCELANKRAEAFGLRDGNAGQKENQREEALQET